MPRKRVEWADFGRIGEMPCIRSSLLTGIASGVGVGVIRGLSIRKSRVVLICVSCQVSTERLSTGPFVASNWAIGTFMVISTGSWYVRLHVYKTIAEVCLVRTLCQRAKREEIRRLQHVIEGTPARYIKKENKDDSKSTP